MPNDSRFSQVLAEELEAVRALASAQLRARAAVAGNRIDELAALTARTEELVWRVQSLERGRSAALSDSPSQPGAPAGDAIAGDRTSAPPATAEQTRELGAAVQRLRELNTQNAVLLRSCLLMVQGELNLLSKLSDGALHYTPAGRVAGHSEALGGGVDYQA